MTESLTVTKEAVLEAANKCPAAKDVLKILFPDAFGNRWMNPSDYGAKKDEWISETGYYLTYSGDETEGIH